MLRRINCLVFLSLLLLAVIALPQQTEAHASLIQSVPVADSQSDDSPDQVILRFNERLENKLFHIKVVNERSQPVTSSEAVMSSDQTEISLDLPALGEGAYTVSYRVISGDGHPVGGSYVFVVGDADPASAARPGLASGGEGLSWTMGLSSYLRFASRILFFLSLMALSGWVFWRMFNRSVSPPIRQVDERWSIGLQRLFLVGLFLMAAFQLPDYLSDGTMQELIAFWGTTTGISWTIMLVLSLAGFALLHRSRIADSLWIIVMLAAQSFIGHSNGIGGENGAILVNFIHLLAAMVWAGGLLYILVHWKNHREHVLQFLPQYSYLALDSIILLVLSGGLLVFLFLPSLSYLLYTQWGITLLVKIGLVLAVILVGAFLRRAIKKNNMNAIQNGVKLDFALMGSILLIVGLLTYLNPLPPNQPFSWHEMGERAHVSVKITPNLPGIKNEFTVQAWLPDDQPAPKRVQLYMNYLDDEDIERMEIPLSPAESNQEQDWFPGFNQYVYTYEGSALALSGRWEIEVRIMDAEDYETVEKQEMQLY